MKAQLPAVSAVISIVLATIPSMGMKSTKHLLKHFTQQYYWFDVTGSVGSIVPNSTPDIKAGDGQPNTKTAIDNVEGNDVGCDGTVWPCIGGYTVESVNLNKARTRATSVRTVSPGIYCQPVTLIKDN